MNVLATRTRHVDGGVVVELRGELDVSSAGVVRDAVRPFVHRYDPGQVSFDCARLDFLDSAGALALLDALRPMAGPGRPVLLDLRPASRSMLHLIGLHHAFELRGAERPVGV